MNNKKNRKLMSNKKVSSIEWLNLYIKGISALNTDEIIKQAKKMHKQEIIDAAADHCYPTCELATIDAEQYYNETFGGNNGEQ
jgi:predicted GIY-YIG superfamily endonuclease